MARKNYVLDTNVLLYDSQALNKFKENHIIIPISVIEEIDRFKKDMSEIGRNARYFSRLLDKLRKKGNLSEGVDLESGGTVKVMLTNEAQRNKLPQELIGEKADNMIMSVAMFLTDSDREHKTIFVTKDVNLRLKADALGIIAEDFESDKVEVDEIYSGYKQVRLSSSEIDQFYTDGSLTAPEQERKFYPNQCLELIDSSNPSHTALVKYNKASNKFIKLITPEEPIWGITARNREQQFAIDLLLDDNLKLVTLTGMAGTGKTLLAIAAGLLKSTDEGVYKRLLVSRPIFPMGKDIGFLPGDIQDKLKPWMQPIFDNVELLFHGSGGEDKKRQGKGYEELMKLGILELEPLTYIRGRSIPNQYMIVDESQNLTPHEIKTIITRAGENTKIVLTGDPYQIDNPYIDASSNGLSYIVERFKNDDISGHISLIKGERSELAERAANLL